MIYEKPAVVAVTPATQAVRANGKHGNSGDGPQPTIAAYEADE